MAIKNFGVDISYWNSITDYNAFLESTYNGMKIKYAFLRLGYIRDGKEKPDASFKKHYNNLVGKIPLGVYIYSFAKTIEEAKEEARWVLRQIKTLNIEFPVVFDYEDSSLLNLKLSKHQYTDICKAFLDEIQKNNYYAMMYCNPSFIECNVYKDELLKYPLWLAHYVPEGKQSQYGQKIWQFGTFKPKGQTGEIDANFAYEQLGKYIRDNGLNSPITYLIKAQKAIDGFDKSEVVAKLKNDGFTVSAIKIS